MNLSLSLTDNLGISRSSGVVDNGVAIVNHAKTTVTATSGDGYTVERTTGGGAWDASAISSQSVNGDCSVVIHWLAGTFAAGLATEDPALSDSYTFLGHKFLTDGGVADIYSTSGVVSSHAFKPYFRIVYTAAGDTLDFYTSNDGVTWGAAVQSLNPGQGAVRYFDCSLNTAGAKFAAKFS